VEVRPVDGQRFDAIAKRLASGVSRRTVAKALAGTALTGAIPLAAVADRVRGRVFRPLGDPAAAQVVTPEPTMPSFAGTRGVLPVDYVSNADPNVPGLASGHVEDDSRFPAATVRVQNDRDFWLAIR
jgi:hypothetical protein